jgi:SPP1 family predicted phage head-tail adaptor
MRNYAKHHLVKFYQAEIRKVEGDGMDTEQTVKTYYKYTKTGYAFSRSSTMNTESEGLELRAYVRQLSANERNEAKALQDDSVLEVVINKRNVVSDMYMEFKGKTYRVGVTDRFQFKDMEIKFRASEVVPVEYDVVEYRSWD